MDILTKAVVRQARNFQKETNMFEQFTDRARKVMSLANQEAQRFNHEYVGTEHILLGLLKEGSGVAFHVLANLDVTLRKARLEVEKLIKSGPDMVTMGKLPQTPRAKKALGYAVEEAEKLNHNYIGTEHVLLGILREKDGSAAQVLLNLGQNLDTIRDELFNLLGVSVQEADQNIPCPQEDAYSPDTLAISPADGPSAISREIGHQIAKLQAKRDRAVDKGHKVSVARITQEIEILEKLENFVLSRLEIKEIESETMNLLKTQEDSDFSKVLTRVDQALAKLLVATTNPECILENVELARKRIDGCLNLVEAFLSYTKSLQ